MTLPARPDTWMPWYIGDYLRDTMHLDAEQDGAYRRLIDACWVRDGELPDDDRALAAIAKLPVRRWLKIKRTVTNFFQKSSNGWTHKRVTAELGKARTLTEARRAAANKTNELRWKDRKRDQSPSDNSATVERVAKPSPMDRPSPSYTESRDSNESLLVKRGGQTPKQLARQMVDIWQAECGDVLAVPTKFTDARVRACRLRLTEDFGDDIERWRALCQRVRGSPHLRGENSRGWRADFDWVLKPANLAKIEEGNYDRLANGAVSNGRQKTAATERFEAGMRVLADEVERRERTRNCSGFGEPESDLRL